MHRLLHPRSFARLLPWRFDEPVLSAAWALFDVYALDQRRLVVELREGPRTLRISVVPNGAEPAATRVGGLALSWMSPGPNDAGAAACRALAQALAAPGPEPEWRIPGDASQQVPEALPVRLDEVSLHDDPDHALLTRDATNYTRLYGGRPRAVRVSKVAGTAIDDAGLSMHYPAPRGHELPPSGSLYPVPSGFFRRDFRAYFAALGCAYGDGVPRTVPSPSTFARAVSRTLGHAAPLQPRLIQGARSSVSSRAWAHAVLSGTLPVGVAPAWAVGVHQRIRAVGALSRIPVDVGMLAHDISLHALGLHAVRRSTWDRLVGIAAEQIRRGGRGAVGRIARFFEGDLTRTAWDVWGALDKPQAFTEAFDGRVDALIASMR